MENKQTYVPKWNEDEDERKYEEEVSCVWILFNPWDAYESGIISYDAGESYVNNTIN